MVQALYTDSCSSAVPDRHARRRQPGRDGVELQVSL